MNASTMSDEQRAQQRYALVYLQSYSNGARMFRVEFYSMTGTDRHESTDYVGSHVTDEANIGRVTTQWLVDAGRP